MMATDTTLLWSVVFGTGLVILMAVMALGWSLRRQRRRYLGLQRQLDELGHAVNALCSGAVGVDRRVARLEQQERDLEARQESLEQRHQESRPYSEAIDRARNGAPAEVLESEFGLTRTEAELLARLHGAHTGYGSSPGSSI